MPVDGLPPSLPPPKAPPLPEEMQSARPAWRIVPQRMTRRSRKRDVAPPPPEPVPEPRQHSWVTWQPNPQLAPTPPSVEPTLLVPDRGSPGLFGPRSPRDSYCAPSELVPQPGSHPWAMRQSKPQPVPAPTLRDSDHDSPSTPPLEDIQAAHPAWLTIPRHVTHRSQERDVAPQLPESDPEQHSWATWQPNPQLSPTPPSVGPILLAPGRRSPGLFGPCSPRNSYSD